MTTALDTSEFIGTTSYHKLFLGDLLTDGAMHVAETCGAFWLMDEITFAIRNARNAKKINFSTFVVVTLKKTRTGSATITFSDGNDLSFTKRIEYTDFPYDTCKLYAVLTEVQGRKRYVIMVPSEY